MFGKCFCSMNLCLILLTLCPCSSKVYVYMCVFHLMSCSCNVLYYFSLLGKVKLLWYRNYLFQITVFPLRHQQAAEVGESKASWTEPTWGDQRPATANTQWAWVQPKVTHTHMYSNRRSFVEFLKHNIVIHTPWNIRLWLEQQKQCQRFSLFYLYIY